MCLVLNHGNDRKLYGANGILRNGMATNGDLRNLYHNGDFMKNYDSEVLYEMYKKKCEKLDEAIAIIKELEHKLHCAQESIRYKTKVIKDIEERLREAALETDPVKMRVTICRALGVSTMDAR
jgi:hypothetical protein